MRRATTARGYRAKPVSGTLQVQGSKKLIGIGGGDFKRERVRRGQNTFLVASGVNVGGGLLPIAVAQSQHS
ncbi:hypothetical protein BB029_28145 [Pseudomonas sp. S3E12]|nr:hypothetical protein BB029_28145 [Pseudomonas sp. S3E12]